MAKIFYINIKDADSAQGYFFNNKRKAQEKGMELYDDFTFDLNGEEFESDFGEQWIYSGIINVKEGFLFYQEDGSMYVDAMSEEEARSAAEQFEGAGAYFPAKLKGGYGECYIGSATEHTNGSWSFEYGDIYEKKQKQTTMKYVPTFESFIGSQKVNEFVTMMEPFDEYGWNDEYDNKYAPIVKALKGKDMYDCVFLGEGFPDFLNETDPIKSFSLKGVADTDDAEDPHGDVEFDLYKFNGMLIGHFTDEMRYSAAVCNEKDAKKWARIFKQNDAGDYLY